MLRIIALLGPRNGHTGLFPGDPAQRAELHLYPLRLYDFADGLYVVDAADASLVGSRLVAIDGTPVAKVFELVEPLVPRDNDSNLRGLAPHFVLTAEVLDGLGITDGDGSADFTFERAGRSSASTSRSRRSPASRYVAQFADPLYGHYPSILPRAAQPLYLAGSARPMWVRTLAGGRAVYVGYNSVRLAVAGCSPQARAPRARAEHAARHRRRASQRRWRQHDVRTAHRRSSARPR